MHIGNKKLYGLFFLLIFIGMMLLALVVQVLKNQGYGIVYQPTISMPRGFYLITPITGLYRHEAVIFYPPAQIDRFLKQHHLVPDSGLLLKQVEGLPGDNVCKKNGKLFINHRYMGRVYRYYAPNKLLPNKPFCSTLPAHQYLLMSTHIKRSFDGRYFGSVQRHVIIGKANLL